MSQSRCDRDGHRLDYITERCKVCGLDRETINKKRIRREMGQIKRTADAKRRKVKRVKGIAGH